MEEIETFVISKEDSIRIDVVIGEATICFKINNIISSLMEANAIAWTRINSLDDERHQVPFYLKVKSDSNKEQWVRILKSAFGNDFPWTLIVAKVVAEVESQIRTRKQDFVADTIESKECSWLLEPFVQEDQINTIFGMGSSGKTLLSLFFSKLIAEELKCKILFIDYEDTPGGWKNKLTKITSLSDFNVSLENFVYFQSDQIPIAEQVEKIKSVIKEHDIKLVIVDSASLATGDSTSDEKAAVRLISALKLLKNTVLLIAHQRKNDGDKTPIGSIQYENQSRNVWNVKGTPDEKDIHIIHLACTHTKANNTYLRREPQGFKIEYTNEHIKITRESALTYFDEKFTIKQRIERLFKDEGSFDVKGIAEALGISINTANKNLSEGKKRDLFVNENGYWNLKTNANISQ